MTNPLLRIQAYGLAWYSAFISPCTPYSVRSGHSPDAPVLRIHQAGHSPDAEDEEEEEECGAHEAKTRLNPIPVKGRR